MWTREREGGKEKGGKEEREERREGGKESRRDRREENTSMPSSSANAVIKVILPT